MWSEHLLCARQILSQLSRKTIYSGKGKVKSIKQNLKTVQYSEVVAVKEKQGKD